MSQNCCSEHAVDGVVHVDGRRVRAGTGIRVGMGRGNTGYPATLLEERSYPSEAGPGRPTGPGVGGDMSSDAPGH